MPEVIIQSGGGSTQVVTLVRNGFGAVIPMGGIEVASTLPALTFTWGADQAVGSPLDRDSIVAAIVAAIGATGNSWRHLDTYSTGNQRGVLVGGPVGSPAEDVRILFVLGDPAPANRFGVNSAVTNALYAAISPDAGGVVGVDNDNFAANGLGPAGNVGDPFAAGNPFSAGAGARFSGFGRFSTDLVINGADVIHAVDSAETLALVKVRASTVTVAHLGATIMPPADSAAESDGRLYGVHVCDPDGLNTSISSNAVQFPGDGNNAAQASSLVFDPSAPATTVRLSKINVINSPSSTTLTSSTGAQMAASMLMRDRSNAAGPTFGWMRQLYFVNDGQHGDAIVDLGASTVGFKISSSTVAINDAMGFINV